MSSQGAMVVSLASFAGAFALSAALTPIVRRWARGRGFVDRPQGPGSHKLHREPTPFGGGIAITVAVLLPMAAILAVAVAGRRVDFIASLLAEWMPQWPYWLGGVAEKLPVALAIIAGALILHLLGIIDDHWPLSPPVKFAVQIAVALMLSVGFEIRAAEALGPIPATAVTVAWIVVLTNAFNFLDNMDGLAGGVACITALVLAACALQVGQVFVPCLLLLVAGAVGGFLLFNFPPATIFMGDAGSLVVGYLLAVCAILTTFYDPEQQRTPFGVFVPLVVFAVPLYDMGSVVVHRWRLGVSIFRADRRHFSHRLVRRGMSPTSAVLTIHLATMATALPAILLPRLDWPGATLVFGQCVCVVALIAILESQDVS
ncbi:MAG: undecaprenyl/decaprenyl-phosphate alpha-N-acetylglucosaminyl 1-phosphate transferase [Phycisphaerae bacterium]|nr:undecaprenyl/decaprenyl-phosphate alpha-N-acetylglucosaminyl 1-phosphate transferase [Phycisphaerae bacterium]